MYCKPKVETATQLSAAEYTMYNKNTLCDCSRALHSTIDDDDEEEEEQPPTQQRSIVINAIDLTSSPVRELREEMFMVVSPF